MSLTPPHPSKDFHMWAIAVRCLYGNRCTVKWSWELLGDDEFGRCGWVVLVYPEEAETVVTIHSRRTAAVSFLSTLTKGWDIGPPLIDPGFGVMLQSLSPTGELFRTSLLEFPFPYPTRWERLLAEVTHDDPVCHTVGDESV